MASKMLAPFAKVRTSMTTGIKSGCGAVSTKVKSMGLLSLVLPLRILQLVLGLGMIGVTGYVSEWHRTGPGHLSPPEVSYMVAIPVVSLLSLIYLELVPRFGFTARFFYEAAAIGIQVFTLLLFASGVLTTTLFLNSLMFCQGMACKAAQGSVGISAVEWLLWSMTTIIAVRELLRSKTRQQQEEMKDAALA